MRKIFGFVLLTLVLLTACAGPPPPEGPAAEATTPDVEVTMPGAGGDSATEGNASNKTSLVKFSVPGMS